MAEEIPEHPQSALTMLRDLTGYLRHSLDGINQTVVTVDAEVGGLMAYLGVQKARFGERLRTHVEGDVLHVTISNTGTLEEANASRRRCPGIGLANVRRRLSLLYPDRHAFTLEGRNGKVVVTMKLEGEPCSGS